MASTYTLKSDAYKTRYMQLTCTQKKDEATNKSTITWTLSSVDGEVNYYSTGPTTVTINGKQVYYKGRTAWDSEVFPAAKGSISDTIEVEHDDDGSKTISVSMSTAIYNGASSAKTYSGNWELDTIPRKATLTSVPTQFSVSALPTIKYSNPMLNSVYKIEACIGSASGGWYSWTPYRELSKTGASHLFTQADVALLNEKVSSSNKELKVKFYLRTTLVSGGSPSFDFLDSTFLMEENDATKPKVTMALEVINPPTFPTSLSRAYVQGKSSVKATITGTGKYGATISKYSLNVGGVTKTSTSNVITSDVITSSGDNVSVKGSAIDSREFPGEASQTISVLAYSKPLVIPLGSENSILCYRSDGNGKRVGNSSSVWIKAKRTYNSIGGNIKCALQWRRRLTKEAWNDNTHKWADLIASTTTTTDEYNALVSGEFLLNESYAIQIRAIDDLKEYDRKDFEIPTQDVALHLGKGGKNVTIGEYCDYSEEYTFRSAWKAIFDKGIKWLDLYNGKDFNDLYDITGYYAGESSPGTVGCLNYPSNNTGMLEVISTMYINETTKKPWGFAYQTYRDYTGAIYTRSYYSSVGWTAWKTITT